MTKKEQRSEEVERVLTHALLNELSLRDAADAFTDDDKERAALYERVRRYLKRTPNGEAFSEAFLKRRSWYRLEASMALACRPEEVEDVLVEGCVSFHWLSENLPSGSRAYHFWYTRLARTRREDFERLKAAHPNQATSDHTAWTGLEIRHSIGRSPARFGTQATAKRRTLGDPANPASEQGYNFFSVRDHEFIPRGQ